MDNAELKSLKTHRVDTRSRSGPGTLLEAQIALTKIPEGEVLEAISSEEETKFDMRLWAWRTGQEFLGVVPADGFDRIFVRRHKIAPPVSRDLREVFRDEVVRRDRIVSILRVTPMTLPELASSLGEPVYDVSLWVWGMQRFGLVRALPKKREEDYYQYAVTEKALIPREEGIVRGTAEPRSEGVLVAPPSSPESPALTTLPPSPANLDLSVGTGARSRRARAGPTARTG